MGTRIGGGLEREDHGREGRGATDTAGNRRPRRFPLRRRRQAVALALAAAAMLVAAQDALGTDAGTTVAVVAARDVAPGAPVGDGDVTEVPLPDDHLPDQAILRAEDAIGKLPAGPLTRGEVLTEPRFAGMALAESLTGTADAHIVAVAPRDSGLTPMLRTGDVVDVLAPGPEAGSARPVANGARVVLADDDGVVLLALPPGAAATVASAGLDLPLTLVLSR